MGDRLWVGDDFRLEELIINLVEEVIRLLKFKMYSWDRERKVNREIDRKVGGFYISVNVLW